MKGELKILDPKDLPAAGAFMLSDYPVTQRDRDDVSQLVVTMLSQPAVEPGRTTDWNEIAAKAGLDHERILLLRRLPLYQQALKEGLRLRALEGVNNSIAAIEETAVRGGQDGVRAAHLLNNIAGTPEPAAQPTFIGKQVNNISIEERLKGRLRARVQEQAGLPPAELQPYVDAEVIGGEEKIPGDE